MSHRIGADIGGTFTDLILSDDGGETFQVGKVLTTPERPDDAVLAGVARVLGEAGSDPDDVSHVVHGTTLFTNAIIERKGAKTALITTEGFRDAIEIAREHRYDMYDLYMRRPAPLAPRHLRFEVSERVLVDGTIRSPLIEDEVLAIVETLRQEAVAAVAVSLIHSYVNDVHERRIAEILGTALPDVALTLSSDLVPEIREYDRTSTTLVNVYVKRIAENYLGRLRRRLTGEARIDGDLFVMQSNGGVSEVETAARCPVRLVESGPAAGALAAAHYGRLLGYKDLLSFDMGGTTAKACVIADGEPSIAPEFEVDRQYQFKKGSGLPVKVPVIEMIEIGTGGGSIARVDAMRRLQVGPDSAGADPGPVAYALGGTEPTVTDADLVLGYLDSEFFLGGAMALDPAAARGAVEERVGDRLGLGVTEAAWGIHQLANESMASAARIHAIERGKDVAKFSLFAFGGAGPVHAFGVAAILRNPRVIYPLGAGVISAVGFLTAPLSLDFVRTFPGPIDDMDWAGAGQVVADMEAEGRTVLGRTIDSDTVRFRRYADMRYRKQGYEIRVPVPDGPIRAECRDAIRVSFEATYRSIYGHTVPETPIDVVSWRVVAYGPKPEVVLPAAGTDARGGAAAAEKGRRRIYLPATKDFAEVPVYDRYRLGAGVTFEGPAIVEERESTVVVNGAATVQVDAANNLIVELAERD
ncbi:MAG: hydantoinase/oxoprolinase family protein [Alphaproteobacteria bacterium]|jgi:N-methylhydantoinase A|nr:hydantoinase/oxoprolinase family protein [Alphaproteobacteria bacterium]